VKLVIIPRRLSELLNVLKIDLAILPICTEDELEVLLEELPTIDKKVLLLLNMHVNASISDGMFKLSRKYKVDDFPGLVEEYFSNAPINPVVLTLNKPKSIIQYTIDQNSIVETRDTNRQTAVLVIDDELVKAGLLLSRGKLLNIAVASVQVYNEFVCTGRTPVTLIQRLFKYI